MQILAIFCLLVVFCHVIEFYRRFLQIFLGFIVMECASRLNFLTQGCEFGGGFMVLGCFSQIFNVLGLFFMFGLGLKVLQSGLHSKGLTHFLGELRGKPRELRNGFSMRNSNRSLCDSKIVFCSSCDSVKFIEKPNSVESNQLFYNTCDLKAKGFLQEYNASEEVESYEEDCECDVLALRKLVKMQRCRTNAALVELDKERIAAASAADEAMAMILRLQSEKSLVEIEANQYRRLAEQKQQYDQEVIQSLRWIIMKQESEVSFLDDRPNSCRKKLKQCREVQDNHEMDIPEESDSKTCLFELLLEEGLDDVLYSSLDYETSILLAA